MIFALCVMGVRDMQFLWTELEKIARRARQGLRLREPDFESQGLRNNAANALGSIGPAAKSAIPVLELALKDTASGVRNNAAIALWKIDRRTNVIDVLLERLRSDKSMDAFERLNLKWTRLWDMKQLGEIGPAAKAAVPVLQSFLKDSDDDLRAAAQQATQSAPVTLPTMVR